MTRPRDIHGPGFTQDEYLRALAAGYETGWWDESGITAPWPKDFADLDHDDDHDQPQQDGDEPPL